MSHIFLSLLQNILIFYHYIKMAQQLCNEEIMFEPRLQAYMEKKEYYTQNKITPCIPLELEFAITKNDLRKMATYQNPQPISPQISTKDNYPPKIQYKNRIHDASLSKCRRIPMPHKPQTDEVLGKLEKHKEIPVFLSGHITIPQSERTYNNQCVDALKKKQQERQDTNFTILRMQMEPDRDPEMGHMMDEIQYGMPERTKKTYGFDNPYEHYYDYIDGEIQDPDHVVLPFPRGGYSTRLDNTDQKKLYKREVY
jgi:hypothetical protein